MFCFALLCFSLLALPCVALGPSTAVALFEALVDPCCELVGLVLTLTSLVSHSRLSSPCLLSTRHALPSLSLYSITSHLTRLLSLHLSICPSVRCENLESLLREATCQCRALLGFYIPDLARLP